MVFKGKDAEEYMRICDHPDLDALERSRRVDEYFSEHAKVTCNPSGEITIDMDLDDFDEMIDKLESDVKSKN